MRTWIVVLFAVACLVTPLAAQAGQLPEVAGVGQPAASFQPAVQAAANPFGTAGEAVVQAAVAPQVAGFLKYIAGSGTARQLGKVCSISCRECVSSCPPGEGVCFRGGC